MKKSWRPRPPLTQAGALLLALACTPVLAYQPAEALSAIDPDQAAARPVLALPPPQQSGPLELASDIERARALWREANARVADFPRGHRDLLRWEAAQAGTRAGNTAAPPARPTLELAEALQLSLRHRPRLFIRPGLNELEQARVRSDYASHVREVQRAWIDAAALQQRARLLRSQREAAALGAELGRRMVRAGNWSNAALLREQSLEAAAWQAGVAAEADARAAAERLARLLGLWQAEAVATLGQRLPTELPALPATLDPGPGIDDIEAAVLRSHPLLASERAEGARNLAALSSRRWQDWQQAVDAALQGLPAGQATPLQPPEISDPRVLRDHPLERAAEWQGRLLDLAATRRSMAREAWLRLQSRHAAAQHGEQVVVSLQAALQQESLLRYNGMLDSTWQLLASARERLGALDAALLARRDYWLARADWQALLAGADYVGDALTANPAGRPARPGH